MIKKNLVYHFYTFEGFENNPVMKLHFHYLKKYSHVFDNSLFVLSVDDVNDKDLLIMTKKKIIECGFKDISFKVVENTQYREALTFYTEIVEKIDSYDGMTFFGHTRGVSTISHTSLEYTFLWLSTIYYSSFEETYLEECEKLLTGVQNPYLFYGNPLFSLSGQKFNKHNLWYFGTMFWINTNLINEYFPSLPKLSSKEYAEKFAGNLTDKIISHNDYRIIFFSFSVYDILKEVVIELFGEEESEKLIEQSVELLNMYTQDE